MPCVSVERKKFAMVAWLDSRWPISILFFFFFLFLFLLFFLLLICGSWPPKSSPGRWGMINIRSAR